MASRKLLLGILLLCIGAILYLLNMIDFAEIFVLFGVVFLVVGAVLSLKKHSNT